MLLSGRNVLAVSGKSGVLAGTGPLPTFLGLWLSWNCRLVMGVILSVTMGCVCAQVESDSLRPH